MGIKRLVDVDLWTDEKVVETFSPEDRYFLLYLLTNPHTTQLGIYHISPRVIAFETGYSVEAVRTLIDRFATSYDLIKYDATTSEVAVKNYLLHSIIRGGKPVLDCMKRELKSVKSTALRAYVYNALKDRELNSTVREFLPFLYYQKKNDNDNENEVSYHDTPHDTPDDTYHESYHDTYHDTRVRKLYGKYGNVELSDDELKELQKSYPTSWSEKIARISTYKKTSGKSYASDFAKIVEWAEQDAAKEKNGSFDTDDFFNAAVERSRQ